jgi:predicted nucleic acid-binding protein
MQELVDSLDVCSGAEYLMDTCFLIHAFEIGKAQDLESFCQKHKVGMSSFNLKEIVLKHHRLHGTVSHHIRDFLKKKRVSSLPIDVQPGERDKERAFVQQFDSRILQIVRDPSDAIILVLALKLHANILTRDKHHLFTTGAKNYLNEYGVKVLNELVH